MRILVTGATGFVGRHLVPHLRGSGHHLVLLKRGTPATEDGDWAAPASLAAVETAPAFPAGIEAVVHLAAANPAKTDAGASDSAAMNEANVEGTAALARLSAREGVGRFVFLSTANVHAARTDGRPVAETDPIAPQSVYSRSKAEAETALRAVLEGTRTRFSILRPAPVFGTGGRGTVAALARLAATPLPLPLGGLGGRRSLIAVDDLIDALLASLSSAATEDETLLLSGGAATPEEIVRALRTGAGRPGRIVPAPRAPLRALARLLGRGETFDALTGDFVLDTASAQRRLGWVPGASLSERLQEMGRAANRRR